MAQLPGLSGLEKFWNRLRGVKSNDRSERTSFSPSEHVVQHTDFDELIDLMFDIMPDPDEVLSAAGLDKSAYRNTLTDAHVSGSLIQRKSRTKLSRLSWDAGEDEEGKITSQAEEALAIVRRQFGTIEKNRGGIRPITNEILNAPYFGMTPLELFWNRLPTSQEKPNGEIQLLNILGKPYEWFGFFPDGTPGIRKSLNTGNKELRKVPNNRYIFVINDHEYHNPFGDRAVKRVWWPFTFKKGGFRFWAEFMEKYGAPFLFGILDGKASEGEMNQFYEDLIKMVRNGVLVKKGGDAANNKIEVIETKDKAGGTDAHARYKNAMNIEISKAILGETLTIENSETGSQAATETHKSQLQDLQDMDKGLVEETFGRIAALITELNVGKEVPPPKATLINDREQEDRDNKIIERDAKLVDKVGIKFTKKYFVKTYDLEEDDFEVPGSAEPGPPTPGQGSPSPEEEPEEDQGDLPFAEKVAFPVQEGLDQYLDERLGQIQGVTSPLAREIKRILAKSENYDDLISNLIVIKEKVPQGTFADVFGQILEVYDVVGTWAAEQNQI